LTAVVVTVILDRMNAQIIKNWWWLPAQERAAG
jgi:hypothetical protein